MDEEWMNEATILLAMTLNTIFRNRLQRGH